MTDSRWKEAALRHVMMFGPKGYSWIDPANDLQDHLRLFQAGAAHGYAQAIEECAKAVIDKRCSQDHEDTCLRCAVQSIRALAEKGDSHGK